MDDPFAEHCSRCTVCSDNGGTYRLCTTGTSICAGEPQPYINSSGLWEKQPNDQENLMFYSFNKHAKGCALCSSACNTEVTDNKYQKEQGLCRKGKKMAHKITGRYWMDEDGKIKGTGHGEIECVIQEGEGKKTIFLVKEKDILIPEGQHLEFGGKLLKKERNEMMAGRKFVNGRRTIMEILSLGR